MGCWKYNMVVNGKPVGVYFFRSRSEEHTSELQSRSDLVCRLLLEKKKFRKQRREPPIIAMVGIDDYSEAFRAGFFHRPLSDRALSSGPSERRGELSYFSSAPPTPRWTASQRSTRHRAILRYAAPWPPD